MRVIAVSRQPVPESKEKPLHIQKPSWLKAKIGGGKTYFNIKRDLRGKNLYTVCEEARCPNISECWGANTATFMILGDTCTRACRFCHVKTGNPGGWLDPDEGRKTARSVKSMGLGYAVITMVDRDDLPDGGAAHVQSVLREIRLAVPEIRIEFLGGDFSGRDKALKTLLTNGPEVFAHNIETVERLTPRVRDARASYRQSLDVLRKAPNLADYPVFTKSGIMLGLGEERQEVLDAMADLRSAGVDFLTLGQYLRPTTRHLAIKRYVTPDEFKAFEQDALAMGFLAVASGPLVRSSYRAADFYEKGMAQRAAATEATD